MTADRVLEGVRVLVTRPRERAEELCFLLEDEGAEVQWLPVLELAPPDDPRPLRSAVEQIHRYRWVLLASPSGAQALVEAAREAGTSDRLTKVQIGAVGPGTSRAARDLGLEIAREAEVNTGGGLFEAIRGSLSPGDEVLLPAAQDGRRELQEALEQAGIRVARVAAYKSEQVPVDGEQWAALLARPPQVIAFGSPRTAEAFLELTGEPGRAMAREAKRVAIGPTTARALAAIDLPAAAVAERPTAAGLVDAVIRAVRG